MAKSFEIKVKERKIREANSIEITLYKSHIMILFYFLFSKLNLYIYTYMCVFAFIWVPLFLKRSSKIKIVMYTSRHECSQGCNVRACCADQGHQDS